MYSDRISTNWDFEVIRDGPLFDCNPIDTSAHGIELDPSEGHKQQHALIRAVIEQLHAAGCEISLSYRVAPEDLQEALAEPQLENFFAAELTYLEQGRD